MAVRPGLTGTTPRAAPATEDSGTGAGDRWVVPVLLLCQGLALLGQAFAASVARAGAAGLGLTLSFLSLALTFASALIVLTRTDLTRRACTTAVVCLGWTTTLQWRITNPLLFTGFDELLHVRTLTDIRTSQGLFQPHPLLAVSPHYPGLESVTALLMQWGLPLTAAGTVTVLAARLVLVLVLYTAVEQLTGNIRAGGLAVAAYAISPQFVFFNSQFSYQTLALPLAVAAVALIARARTADDARPLLAGATICLLAVAVSHHVTSLLTAMFLVLWAAVARGGRAVRRIRMAALVGVGSTSLWALVQWSLLQDYFGPIASDLTAQVRGEGGGPRATFSDASGVPTPEWQRVLLLYYAGIVSVVTLVVVLNGLRSSARRWLPARHARPGVVEPTPQRLVVLIAAILPTVFAARALPSGGEFGDRATSFLFLPFSMLVAVVVTRSRPPRWLSMVVVRWTGLVLATLAFVGGYILGGGPDWQRLPGPYLVSADMRSVDSETLATTRWAAENLPPGSRFAADRVSGDLLSAHARMWPVLQEGDRGVPSLYFADEWGEDQTRLAQELRVRFLYVDTRLADRLPHVGVYFFRGETPAPEQLTEEQLTKFDDVPGIEVVYRHGPVAIYDLAPLGVPVAHAQTGWTGDRTPPPVIVQVVIGLSAAAGIVLMRTRVRRTVVSACRRLVHAAGRSFTLAVALGAVTVVAVVLALCHVFLGPAAYAAVAVVLAGAGHRHLSRTRDLVRALPGRGPLVVLMASVVATAAAGGVAIASAHSTDVAAVQMILDDPSAVHEAPR